MSIHFQDNSLWAFGVIIGDQAGRQSFIRFDVPSDYYYLAHSVPIYDCNTFKDFWIRWDNSTVETGNGLVTGVNTFLSESCNISWTAIIEMYIDSPESAADWRFTKQVNRFV